MPAKKKTSAKLAKRDANLAADNRIRRFPTESLAIILGCSGLLTTLSLMSFHPDDLSLNSSGTPELHNWIGPAGAYWSDLLLQVFGLGAYPLALGLLLAAWRSALGRWVLPGLRETIGLLSLVAWVGTLAEVVDAAPSPHYPAGGVLGALLRQWLETQFATTGAALISGAAVLWSLSLTIDGVLTGLGGTGLSLGRRALLFGRAGMAWTSSALRSYASKRAELRKAKPTESKAAWSFRNAPKKASEEDRSLQDALLERARTDGARNGDAIAEKITRKKKRVKAARVADHSDANFALHQAVDLASEEEFEMGGQVALAKVDEPQSGPTPVPLSEVIVEPEAVRVQAAQVAAESEAADASEGPAAEEATPAKPSPRRVRKTVSEPEIVDVRPEIDTEAVEKATGAVAEPPPSRTYELPAISLLDYEATERAPIDPERLRDNAQRLTKTLKHYGIEGHVREIRPGPVVTMYEYVPAPGTKVSKISGLADDLAMSMEALRVRIVAPIPGKGAVGIEIPNDERETVFLKELLSHDSFKRSKSRVTVALGKDIEGNSYSSDLAKMPHLLVAGATGSGKSVSVNAMIMSILFKATPDEVRMIMVDPKMLELSVYDGIPHLLLPVVTDPKKASLALRWAVEEMERRYKCLSSLGVRGIDGYNAKVRKAQEQGRELTIKNDEGEDEPCEPLPYIVVVVDELADLMMVAAREVEASIMRLAQMARAAGIHLILATQRPSVDVLTGVIKANFPTRIAFQVASKHDSRTILDANGAEHLLGRGDMLFLSPGAGGMKRVHGAYVSEEEIERVVNILKEQGNPDYDDTILAPRESMDAEVPEDEEHDEMFDLAVSIVSETRQASISMIQRRLRIGYNRAARIVEQMERDGMVGPADGSKPREVLLPPAA